MNRRVALTLLILAFGNAPRSARADEGPPDAVRAWIMLGAGVTPRFDGAASYGPAPVIAGRVEWGRRYLQISGTIVRVNVLGLEHLELGPALNVTLGRAGAAGTRVAALGDLGPAVELGGFIGLSWRDVLIPSTQLWTAVQVTQDLTGTHGGWQTAAHAYAAWAPSERWNLGLEARLHLGSAAFNRTYFGVTEAGAQASGLPAADPAAGLHKVSLTLNLSRAVSSSWWVTGVFGSRHLIGDAADSPLVEDGGAGAALVGALAVSYTFW